MTTDKLQEQELRWKAMINRSPRFDSTPKDKKGIELTRMDSFLDGGYDIFDVLESHAANTQMKIKVKNTLDNPIDLKETSLFQSLFSRLKEQMKELV